MDRQRTLSQLTQKMGAALAAEDWPALTAINTLMAASLPQLAREGRWSAPEQAALNALYQLHTKAAARCAQAAAELGQRLHDMQANKEGWIAYALSGETAETGNNE